MLTLIAKTTTYKQLKSGQNSIDIIQIIKIIQTLDQGRHESATNEKKQYNNTHYFSINRDDTVLKSNHTIHTAANQMLYPIQQK